MILYNSAFDEGALLVIAQKNHILSPVLETTKYYLGGRSPETFRGCRDI